MWVFLARGLYGSEILNFRVEIAGEGGVLFSRLFISLLRWCITRCWKREGIHTGSVHCFCIGAFLYRCAERARGDEIHWKRFFPAGNLLAFRCYRRLWN